MSQLWVYVEGRKRSNLKEDLGSSESRRTADFGLGLGIFGV